MLSAVLLLAMLADEPLKNLFDCKAFNSEGIWAVHVHQFINGQQKPLIIEGPFKNRKKAEKRCDKLAGQWENLYGPRKLKGKRK